MLGGVLWATKLHPALHQYRERRWWTVPFKVPRREILDNCRLQSDINWKSVIEKCEWEEVWEECLLCIVWSHTAFECSRKLACCCSLKKKLGYAFITGNILSHHIIGQLNSQLLKRWLYKVTQTKLDQTGWSQLLHTLDVSHPAHVGKCKQITTTTVLGNLKMC